MSKPLTPEAWARIRGVWEGDLRTGFLWVARELRLRVTEHAVRRRAKLEGWSKAASLPTIVERAQLEADNAAGLKIRADSISELGVQNAVDLRSAIIETHRAEWAKHRETYTLASIEQAEQPAHRAKVAKLAAETLKIRQEGERKAWGLDAIADNDTGSVKTMEQLDAMFIEAMQRSMAMRDAVRLERGELLR